MSSIYDWSLVAANNGTADSLINFAEGQAPSTVNNSAREVMARVAEFLADMGGALTAGGTANVLTVTTNSPFTAYADGLMLALRIATDNSGAATLNANGIGAKSIRKMVAAGETALTGNEMQATGIYVLRYSTALNAAAGGWLLLDPTIDIASFAPLASPALTGTPTAPTAAPGTNTIQIATTGFVAAAITAAISALSAVYQPLSAVLTALAGIGTAVAGDIIYASGAGTWARRAKGSDGQILQLASGLPAWSAGPTFTKSYDSGQQTITSAGALTLAHGLGVKPALVQYVLQCVTAEAGYSIGNEVWQVQSNPGTTFGTLAMVADATNITVRYGANSTSFWATNFTNGGGAVGLTNANWRLVVRAWA